MKNYASRFDTYSNSIRNSRIGRSRQRLNCIDLRRMIENLALLFITRTGAQLSIHSPQGLRSLTFWVRNLDAAELPQMQALEKRKATSTTAKLVVFI